MGKEKRDRSRSPSWSSENDHRSKRHKKSKHKNKHKKHKKHKNKHKHKHKRIRSDQNPKDRSTPPKNKEDKGDLSNNSKAETGPILQIDAATTPAPSIKDTSTEPNAEPATKNKEDKGDLTNGSTAGTGPVPQIEMVTPAPSPADAAASVPAPRKATAAPARETQAASTTPATTQPAPAPAPAASTAVPEKPKKALTKAEKFRFRKEKLRLLMLAKKKKKEEEGEKKKEEEGKGSGKGPTVSTKKESAFKSSGFVKQAKRSGAAVFSFSSTSKNAPLGRKKPKSVFSFSSSASSNLTKRALQTDPFGYSKPESPAKSDKKTSKPEEDPLAAYMKTLQSKDLVPQQAVKPAAVAKVEPEIDAAPVQTISMEDIMKLASGEKVGAGDGTTQETEEEVDEDTYYQEWKAAVAKKKEDEAARQKLLDERMEEGKKAAEKRARLQKSLGVIYEDGEDQATRYSAMESRSALDILREKMKKKELKTVNHATVDYLTVRKQFYTESREVAAQTAAEVMAKRKKMRIKLRGKACPKPAFKWEHCGLSPKILHVLRKKGFLAPYAIQAQAMPALMMGRDIIGVAKTGSGKTLAFLLPAIRHMLDQPPLMDGDGPIVLIMAPARELAVQIFKEAEKFMKVLGRRVCVVYGGSPVSEQINSLRRGAEIVVATPGRLIDLLCMNAGRLMSLSRVSFLILDEADRMFDMGFEPQISMVIRNVRPDRQTALFSATFPSHVEAVARKLLRYKPLEIVVGGRTRVSDNITQIVEVHKEEERFMRLLQILGLWYEKGNILVFVDTQRLCDSLFTRLMKAGYYGLSLHGGKDQADRDQTIADFKNKIRTILVATSVAGRGLDVKGLVLVVNFACPNHLEDYVHRVGRTGRAENMGTAFTFITPEEEKFSPDLVKALEQSDQDIPNELAAMSAAFLAKVKCGKARKRASGYSTSKGYDFGTEEATEKAFAKEVRKIRMEVGAGIRPAEDLIEAEKLLDQEKVKKNEEGEKKKLEALLKKAKGNPHELAKIQAQQMVAKITAGGATTGAGLGATMAKITIAKRMAAMTKDGKMTAQQSVAAAQAFAAALNIQQSLMKQQEMMNGAQVGQTTEKPDHFSEDIEINDYPQKARWKACRRDHLDPIKDINRVAITTRGVFVPPGRKCPATERKLYLCIEGDTAIQVKRAKAEILNLLEEETRNMGFDKSMYGKYSVV